MKPKKILLWFLFGLIAFNVFNYVKMHTRGDVIIYKRFAKGLMNQDKYLIQSHSNRDFAEQLVPSNAARAKSFEDVTVVFTYYRIKDRQVSEDGRMTTLVAEQISRVNPEGQDTIWGADTMKIRQTVRLRMENNAWKVEYFADPFTLE